MRSYDEIWATARDERPFSNGTEGYGWMENWCWAPCQQPDEVAWQRYEEGKRKTPPKSGTGCPLILVAMLGRTPTEWLKQEREDGLICIGDQYHCVEFRPPGSGGEPGPPRPKRDPPGQLALFDRPPAQRRMLRQPELARDTVGAPC
jgi:hypothetical protein